jgi:hypothetical protein
VCRSAKSLCFILAAGIAILAIGCALFFFEALKARRLLQAATQT